MFSQYGEVVNINLVRDRKTGKSKGFAFLCYEDQRSTVLAVDNLNTIRVLDRIIRVDHVEEYKVPKEFENMTEELKKLHDEGCAPKPMSLPSSSGSKRRSDSSSSSDDESSGHRHKKKKHHHHHKKSSKKHKKEKSRH